MRLRPNLLSDSQRLREGLATESVVLRESLFVLRASWRHTNVVEEHSRITADSVANPSRINIRGLKNLEEGLA
jgi:hypothetical protein